MSKVKILGDSFCVISKIKMEDLRQIQKWVPERLVATKVDDEGYTEEVFRIGAGVKPEFNKFGISFTSVEDEFAAATFNLPIGLTPVQKKEYIKNEYGAGILKLNKLEKELEEVMDQLANDFADIDSSIN